MLGKVLAADPIPTLEFWIQATLKTLDQFNAKGSWEMV